MAQTKIRIDRKDPKELVKCDACDKQRALLITVGFNYIRVCEICAEAIQNKLKAELYPEPNA